MAIVFGDFDLDGFWEPPGPSPDDYAGSPPTDEAVAEVEGHLGYQLPASYVEFMRVQNGGIPRRPCHATAEKTWADDHLTIYGIFSIGDTQPYSLCGGMGSQFRVDEWGYPPIGVYFADSPSAGHDMLCLDYRACGPTGEPQVAHVSQRADDKIVTVANDFEAFVRGLQAESAFADDD